MAALKYADPRRFWTLVVAGGLTLVAVLSVPVLMVLLGPPDAPHRPAVVVTGPGAPAPEVAPILGTRDLVENARICSRAVSDLEQLARKYPRYVDVAGRDRARVEVLLTAVGTICDADQARRSSQHLADWIGSAAR